MVACITGGSGTCGLIGPWLVGALFGILGKYQVAFAVSSICVALKVTAAAPRRTICPGKEKSHAQDQTADEG